MTRAGRVETEHPKGAKTPSQKMGPWHPAQRGELTPRGENKARYIIRASFSQERMTYLPDETRVIYLYKDYQPPCSFVGLD